MEGVSWDFVSEMFGRQTKKETSVSVHKDHTLVAPCEDTLHAQIDG
jgi:hypothetical protein